MFVGTALSVRLLVYAGLSLFNISGPYVYMVVCVLYAYYLTLHWPEMIQAIGAECGMDIPTDVVSKMTVTDKSWFLCQNPLTGVCKFHGRVESFFPAIFSLHRTLLGT